MVPVGTGALTVPAQVVTASGGMGGFIAIGTGALTVPAQVLAGSGLMVPDGAGALTQPFPVLAATGWLIPDGTGALTQPMQVIAGTGALSFASVQAGPQPGVGRVGISLVPPSGLGRVNSTQSGVGRYLPPRRGGGR